MNSFKPILTPKPFYKVDRIFIYMNIREGALTAPPEQENIIRDFLKRFHDTFERVIEERGKMDWYFFKNLVKRFEAENLSIKRGVKLIVKFIFRPTIGHSGALDQMSNKEYVLEMNMFHHFVGLEDSNFIEGIRWNDFYKTFIHEYKHFLQAIKSKGKTFSDTKKDYMDQPQEQQAWAEGYLEQLRHELHTDDPKKIWNYVIKHGLWASVGLRDLKTTNPSAWKAIMKQVVLAAQRDLKQET